MKTQDERKQRRAARKPSRDVNRLTASTLHRSSDEESPSAQERFLLLAGYPLLLLFALIWCTIHPLMDPDIWLHMAFGRYVLEHGAFPPGDIFSHTAAGQPWISSGWASSVLFELIYRVAGATGLVGTVLIVIYAAYLSLYVAAVRVFGDRGSIMLLLISAALASILRFTPRPEIFSQLFLAALLLTLGAGMNALSGQSGAVGNTGDVRIATKRLWLAPFLMAGWANFHAAFPAGLLPIGLCGGYLLYRVIRLSERDLLKPMIPLSLCFVTWMLNPYGWQIAFLSQRIKRLPDVRQLVFEWQPMFGSNGNNLPWGVVAGAAGVILLSTVSIARSPSRGKLWVVPVIAAFTVLQLREVRHTALAAIAIAGIAVPYSNNLWNRAWFVVPGLVVAGIGLIVGLQFTGRLHFGSGWPTSRLDDSLLPCTATRFMKSNPPPQSIYNSYGPGGYLMYHLGPEMKVFMDGRNDVYPVKVWTDFFEIQDNLMSVDDATSRYGLNSFFIYSRYNNSNPSNLANRLTAHKEWALVYFDDHYALFIRRTEASRDYIAAHGYEWVTPFDLKRMYAGYDNPETRPVVMAEAKRALEISGQSAKAHLLAGALEREAGNTNAAQAHFDAATGKDASVSVGVQQ